MVRLLEFNQLKQIFHFLLDDETFTASTRTCTRPCGVHSDQNHVKVKGQKKLHDELENKIPTLCRGLLVTARARKPPEASKSASVAVISRNAMEVKFELYFCGRAGFKREF